MHILTPKPASPWWLAPLAAVLFASVEASAYDTASFSGGPSGVAKFLMVALPSGKTCDWLWLNGPRLDNQWKEVSFSFIPEGDGLMTITIGAWAPWREGDVPFYFDDIRCNGAELDREGWTFPPPRETDRKTGAIHDVTGFSPSGKPCLRLYQGPGASRELEVKKGQKVEFTMRAKSGSVLEAYAERLGEVAADLSVSLKLAATGSGGTGGVSGKLATCLDELLAMSAKDLGVQLPSLPDGDQGPAVVREKVLELAAACEAKVKGSGAEVHPALYDNLPARKAFLEKIRQLALLASELRTDLLLSFMLRKD